MGVTNVVVGGGGSRLPFETKYTSQACLCMSFWLKLLFDPPLTLQKGLALLSHFGIRGKRQNVL